MNDSFRFSGNSSILFVLTAGVGPLLIHAIKDLYNVTEYHMRRVTKNLHILNLMFH